MRGRSNRSVIFQSISLHLWLWLSALMVSGCAVIASTTGVSTPSPFTKPAPAAGDWNCEAERNRALCAMKNGLAAHYTHDFETSNRRLHEAEDKMDELFTRSISQEAATFVINDRMAAYPGEDFERVMVNLFMALNYVYLGKWEDALVEARKVDVKLHDINDKYDPDKKNIYDEDAFVRFIMGLLYEAQGEINDAFVSYRNAEEIYADYQTLYDVNAPNLLLTKLLTSACLITQEDADHYQRKYPDIKPSPPSARKRFGKVYFLHYNGLCPTKKEKTVEIDIPGQPAFKMAFPKFERRAHRIQRCTIELLPIDGGASCRTNTEVGEDIGAIAIQNLENRSIRVKAKAAARGIGKTFAQARINKAIDDASMPDFFKGLAKRGAKEVVKATEKADLRCCSRLPDQIYVGYAQLPPGTYRIIVHAKDAGGRVVQEIDLPEITIGRGEKQFISFRTTQ